MKKILKQILFILLAVILLFGVFYIFYIIPDDSRITMPEITNEKMQGRQLPAYDFTKYLSSAKITSPDFDTAYNLLKLYPYKQDSRFMHVHKMNLHLSLGWFPLKTQHQDCIFAPDNTELEYNISLPDKPVLKFNYGIISSINKHLMKPMSFFVIITTKDGKEHKVFEKNEFPIAPFRWQSTDGFYKNIYKYFHPELSDRDSKWNSAEVELSEFKNQSVKIKFITKAVAIQKEKYNINDFENSACTGTKCFTETAKGKGQDLKGISAGLSFWGQPKLFNTCDMKSPDSVGGQFQHLNSSTGNADDAAVGRVMKGASGSCRRGSTEVEKIDKPNVILVVIDSMRGDCVSKEYSPNIYRYAKEGVYFTKALSNGNMTKLSVPSFLMSRYPTEISEITMHYDVSKDEREKFYSRNLETLAGELKNNGYHTAGIGSCSLFCDGHGFSADLGFDEMINLEHSGYSPPHVTMTGIDWLKKHGKEKFFLMLYYDGPHGPYRPPLKYLKASLKQGSLFTKTREKLYLGDVIYHDEYIGFLRKYLEASGLDKNTVIVFTADHGVTFRSIKFDWPTRYGAWDKKLKSFHSHGVSITPEDINVPLIFYNGKNNQKIDTYVQLLDMAPTILDITGSKIPAGFKGSSLVDSFDSGKFAGHLVTYHQGWQNRGVYWKERWLYINNFREREGFPKESIVPEELYDLSKDINCLRNLALVHPWNISMTVKTRELLRNFIPNSGKYKMLFLANKNSKAVVSIDYNNIEKGFKYSLETKGKVLNKTDKGFSVELIPGQDFEFGGINSSQTFTIKCLVDKILLKKQQVLAGQNALPVLNTLSLSQKDLVLLEGWPDEKTLLEAGAKPKLILGTVTGEAKAKENIGSSSTQLKSMLEQWGYINQ